MARLKARKGLLILFTLVLVTSLAIMALPMAGTVGASPDEWYVDGALGTDGGAPQGTGPGALAFKTIQYAINDSRVTVGDTINVAAGTYTENVSINKAGISLLGAKAGIAACPLNPADRGTSESIVNGTITLQASNITVDGFEIHSGTANGVYITTAGSSPTVKNNVISGPASGTQSGIISQRTIFAQIIHNNIQGYGYGILLDGHLSDSPSTIDGNCLSNNTVVGLILMGTLSNGHTLINNLIENNPGAGIVIAQGGHLISNNIIRNNNQSGIYIDVWPRTTGIQILGNTIEGNSNGININNHAGNISGGLATFNVIVSNKNYGVTNNQPQAFNAVNNWWGCNDGPGPVGPGSGDNVSGNVTYDPWLILKVSANPPSIPADGISTSIITADMTMNSDGVDSGGYVPDGTEIVFTTNRGSIGSLTTTKTTTSGIATALFTSDTKGLPVTISAEAPTCYTCTIAAATVSVTLTPPVGGEAYPVNKASVLAPWIVLAVLLVGGISWFTLRRRRAQSQT